MAEPSTPGDARRHGLRRSRWIAGGAAVGAAVVLTGTIAAVDAAPGDGGSTTSPSVTSGRDEGSDEYEEARPFTPQEQAPAIVPGQSVVPQPQTSSGGS